MDRVRRRILPSIPLIDLFSPLDFFFHFRESSSRDDGPFELFRSSCRDEFNYIGKKTGCVPVCVAARGPCAKTNFVFRQIAVDIDTRSSRCPLPRDSATMHVASTDASCSRASLSTMPERKVGRHAEKNRTCAKKMCDTAFPQLLLRESRVYRSLCCEIHVTTHGQSFFFLLLSFENLTVDSARFVARLLFYDRFFHGIERWPGVDDGHARCVLGGYLV